MLADRDLLFSAFHTAGTYGRVDQSVYLLTAPNFFTIAQYWRDGFLPLWNPYVGFGMPLIGDQQSCIFSPWRMLASFSPTVGYYNFQMYLQLAFGSVGGYLLGRFLGLGKIASLLLALCFELSPFSLSYLELIGGPVQTAYPWILLAFLRAAECSTLLRVATAGAAVALALYSGHALLAFTGTLACSLCFLLFSIAVYNAKEPTGKRVLKAFSGLLAIGAFSLAFAAPIVLPFFECLRNSFCYKFDTVQNWASPLAIPYFLMHAGSGTWSPFIGVLALPLIVRALLPVQGAGPVELGAVEARKCFCICVAAVIMSLVVCGFGPLSPLVNQTPLKLISTTYFAVPTIFLCSVAAAFGVNAIRRAGFGSGRQLFAVIAVTLATLAIPLALHVLKADLHSVTFDEQLPTTDLISKFWTVDLIVGLFFAAVALASYKRKLSLQMAAIASLSLMMISVLSVSRIALLPTPRFDFVQTPAHQFFKEHDGRVAPLGFNVFVANPSAVYRIRSLALHNPVMLRRYVNFLKAASGHADHFNALLEYSPISALIDLSSVKYVIALSSVFSDSDLPETTKVLNKQAYKFDENLRISGCELGYDVENRQIVGRVNWQCSSKESSNYSYIAVFSKPNGELISYGNSTPCCPPGAVAKARRWNFDALVPSAVAPGASFTLGIKVFDSSKGKFLTSDSSTNKDNLVILGTWQRPVRNNAPSTNRFRLVKEFGPHNIRIYENANALPEAYLVSHIKIVDSSRAALDALRSQRPALDYSVIVEADEHNSLAPLAASASEDRALFSSAIVPSESTREALDALQKSRPDGDERAVPVKVVRNSPNSISIECTSKKPSMLVVTDLYYPGWTAKVDGVSTPVYAANYAFRGVALSPGRHVIDMQFSPLSFYIGVGVALSVVALIIGFVLFRIRPFRAFVSGK